jgi:hypothetical protein
VTVTLRSSSREVVLGGTIELMRVLGELDAELGIRG